MTEDLSFIERLNNLRNQNECEFDCCLSDVTWGKQLELLYDIVSSYCSIKDPCNADLPEKLAYLGLTIQNFYSALNLARQGLYSPAQALLRCAMEHGLRWELSISQKGFPCMSGPKKGYTELDCLEPEQLREKIETDLWYNEGLCAIYNILTGDIHLKIGTLDPRQEQANVCSSRFLKVMTPNKTKTHLSVDMFGRFDSQDSNYFYILWTRLCCRAISKSVEKFPVLREHYECIYPMEPQLKLVIDHKALVDEMWKYEPLRKGISFIDLNTGNIVQKEFSLEDQNSSLFFQIPICERDPLIKMRNSSQLPIPKCSLRIKWKIIERFVKEYGLNCELPKKKKDRTSKEFNKAEKYCETNNPNDWKSYRNQNLIEWLHHYNYYLQ